MSFGRGRQALGKGLGALIPAPRYSSHGDDFFLCPLEAIRPDPGQPRQRFDDDALAELVASVKEKGVLQPLIVRRDGDGETYLLVAGERRLRAAQAAGLAEVPVLVKDVASAEAFELALIENIQRQDLNAIEEACAYRRLVDEHGHTQDVVARRVGKDRSTVANALRLLRLEPTLQERIMDGRLSAGHARSLLSVTDPGRRSELADRVEREGLSVRQAEEAARRLKSGEPDPAAPRRNRRRPPLQPYFDTVATELSQLLEVPVVVKSRGRKGKVIIDFGSVEQLRRVREALLAALGPPQA
jgi:ParB family chromosome partitioning protein